MGIHRAKPEELERFFAVYANTYHLVCKFFRDKGTVSVNSHKGSSKNLKSAAKKLSLQGWLIDGEPICPACFKRKNLGIEDK